jgi:hypothetical protein
MDFILRLENSGFATWVREGGTLWSYPAILFCHTIGLATLSGLNAGIDLRLLGFARRIPLAPLRSLFPIMWFAFAVTAASGSALLIADMTARLGSTIFYVKLMFVALALITMQLIKRSVFNTQDIDNKPLPSNAKVLAVVSIAFWIAATTAGRLMAYLGPVSGLD